MVSAFTLGFIFGLLGGWISAILILIAILFFRRVIEHQLTLVEKQVGIIGPRPKGFIVEPASEADEVRQEIIEENQRQGRDTKLDELR